MQRKRCDTVNHSQYGGVVSKLDADLGFSFEVQINHCSFRPIIDLDFSHKAVRCSVLRHDGELGPEVTPRLERWRRWMQRWMPRRRRWGR